MAYKEGWGKCRISQRWECSRFTCGLEVQMEKGLYAQIIQFWFTYRVAYFEYCAQCWWKNLRNTIVRAGADSEEGDPVDHDAEQPPYLGAFLVQKKGRVSVGRERGV